MRSHDVREALLQVRAPTLVLTNRHDPVAHPDNSREVAALVPGATMHELDGNEHKPLLLEIPDGARTSDLERPRRGPTRVSGRARVSELTAIGVGRVELGAVPRRRGPHARPRSQPKSGRRANRLLPTLTRSSDVIAP